MLTVLMIVAAAASAAAGHEPVELEMQRVLELELTPADTHRYTIQADGGQFVFVAVDQMSIDVVVQLNGPDGVVLQEIDADSPWEMETLVFSTQEAGEYLVLVRAFDPEASRGHYAITLERKEVIASSPSARVDQLLAPWSRPGHPGAVVAVMRGGELLHQRGYGLANLECATPVTSGTVFRLGSMAKQFTAFAIAMLEERGDLSLDDDVREHLPELAETGETVTIRHLLDHTSGLREQFNLLALAGYTLDDAVTGEAVLRLAARQRELNAPPGEEYSYCNTGYVLLAEIVSRVVGEPFPEWMAENVFEPLGMTSTRFADGSREIIPGRAYAYGYGDEGGLVKMDRSFSIYGSGGLYSTCDDLLKWVRNFEDGRVGGADVIRRVQRSGTLNNGETVGYAFGNHVDERGGLRVLSHGGMVGGFKCWLERFPDQRLSVVVLSNMRTLWPDELSARIAEFYLSFEMDEPEATESVPEPGVGSPADRVDETESFEPTPDEMREYEGDYVSRELDSTLTVLVHEERLFIESMRHGRVFLMPAAQDEFESFVWFLPGVRFERDSRGAITGLRILGRKARNVEFVRRG
jgi:CubicO group peptidase (beta-lactamase class C family)